MNNLSKILVLLFAALLAVGAVLYFVKTMLDPPAPVIAENGYVTLIDEAVNEYSESRQSSYEESYRPVLDRIERFHTEGRLTGKEYDRTRCELAAIYAPRLAQDCYRRLMMSWDDNDMDEMENRIYRLLNQRLYAGGGAVADRDSESASSLHEIADVLKLSREARNMCAAPSYISLADSRLKMAKIRSFLNNDYLKHNTSLVNGVRDYGSKLGEQHYRALTGLVDALAACMVMSDDEFSQQYSEAVAAINEYDTNASAVYGTAISTEPLRQRIDKYLRWYKS